MTEHNQAPLSPEVKPPSQPTPKESTVGSAIDADAKSATIEPETPVLEPEYGGDPLAYYGALRTALPEERIGQILRKVREAVGLSIADVRAKTLHQEQKLISIERMEISSLSRGYVTPIVRDFAKTIGLDGDTVVADYTADCGTIETVTAPEKIVTPDTEPRSSVLRPALAAAAVMGLAAMGGGVFLLAGTGNETAGPQLATQPLNGAAESLFSDVPMTERVRVENMELTLIALQDAWVEVRGPDGTLYRNRIMRAGETYVPRAGAGWTISARNGAAFEWRLGDAVIGPLGPEDAAVFAASVDAAAARAKDSATPALAAAGNGQPSR